MAEPFKNMFNEKLVHDLAYLIHKNDNQFDDESFIKAIMKQLDSLELKERMRLISTSINEYWDAPYSQKIHILMLVKDELPQDENFVLASMVFPDFVEVFGIDEYEISMKALEHFTIESSSEFAIRPFILKYEEKSMNQMQKWAMHNNEHVRRLATEGCRPRLPWAMALPCFKKDPSKVLKILEILKNDESKYVRKSVANNLNDISKDNPSIVISFIKNNIGHNTNLDWILKHGARTLLKESNSEILSLFGYSNTNIKLSELNHEKAVKIGSELAFSFKIESTKKLGKIRVEYAIDFVRKNGKKTKKVFHISSADCKQKMKSIQTKHSFKKVTTRNYYVGIHKLTILVNGKALSSSEFDLMEE